MSVPPTEGEARQTLLVQVETIRLQVAYWAEFDRAARERKGLSTDDSTHIYAPPCWPSHGMLANWVDCLRRVEDRLGAQ